jgi:hypothetical protein
MINYDDIKAYVDEGKTSAEIVAVFDTIPTFVKDTHTADVWRTLSKYGVVLDGTTPQRSGSLVTHMADNNDPTGTGDATLNTVAITGYNQLIGRPHSDKEVIRSHSDPQIALATQLLCNIVVGLSSFPFTPESIKADLDVLTGGRLYADVTVEYIDQLKTDEAAKVADKVEQDAANAALQIKQDALNEVQLAFEAAMTEFRKDDSTATSIKAAAVTSLG